MARPGIQKHLDMAPLLRCPLCHEPMHATVSSVRCGHGHDFSVSSKGFLNLVPSQAPLRGYDEEFFSCRRRVMEHGYYTCVQKGVVEAVCRHLPTEPSCAAGGVLLDAGCGEGTYGRTLGAHAGCSVIGMDLARDAIRRAARGGGPERWIVADLANIPLVDDSIDVVTNIFTPANYGEFQRVLKPDGLLVKVVPAPRHMQELRELAGEHLGHAAFNDHGVIEHLERHMDIVSRTRVTGTSPVGPSDAWDLIRMSPVAFSVDPSALDRRALSEITVDAEVICARPR